jgi:hypothetical protein
VSVLAASPLVLDPRSSRSVPPLEGVAISLKERTWVDEVVASA